MSERDWALLGKQLGCDPATSQGPLGRLYRQREKCKRCGKPAGPFGATLPDFCGCDQREGITFASKALGDARRD